MISPLRKRTRDGAIYTRRTEVESLLRELVSLPLSSLVERCSVQDRRACDYVPSECLLYFVRSLRNQPGTPEFKRLYELLMQRVLARLPREGSPDGETPTQSSIRDAVFGQLVLLLAQDRLEYSEALDFYEVQFDSGLQKLRFTAVKRAKRRDEPLAPLELPDEPGEFSSEVETAIREGSDFSFEDYRLDLDAAIDELPTDHARVIQMLRDGFPIYSQDPDEVTIAKTLGRSEKTIRTYRDLAIAALRARLTSQDEP